MARRGVLYMVWGDSIEPVLDRSLVALRRWHPELPVHVERLSSGTDPIRGLLRKSRMFALSPFEETLFLDADTVVLGPLDYGFERASRFGLACAINECPWARRYADLSLQGDMIEYNTGVLFFARQARVVFDAWAACAETLDSSIEWMEGNQLNRMAFNDQAGFAKAIEDTGVSPFVLPLNWNYRPQFQRSFFGPIRIWHDRSEVPDWILRENELYRSPKGMMRLYAVKITP
jgi:hypothetical protein